MFHVVVLQEMFLSYFQIPRVATMLNMRKDWRRWELNRCEQGWV